MISHSWESEGRLKVHSRCWEMEIENFVWVSVWFYCVLVPVDSTARLLLVLCFVWLTLMWADQLMNIISYMLWGLKNLRVKDSYLLKNSHLILTVVVLGPLLQDYLCFVACNCIQKVASWHWLEFFNNWWQRRWGGILEEPRKYYSAVFSLLSGYWEVIWVGLRGPKMIIEESMDKCEM